MKTRIIFLSIVVAVFSVNIFAQKQDAASAVKAFYKFHFSHENIFNRKQVELRRSFFTPRLRQLFDAELKRQKIYTKKHPTDKSYFDGFSFEPIEFCPKDYSIGTSQMNQQSATVKVNFVYGKSSCSANDGTKIFYKVALQKIGEKWLIDDVIYDDESDLISAFNEAAKIK